MPIMDGYEACQRIDKYFTSQDSLGERPPIYALTADIDPVTEETIRQYPFDVQFEQLRLDHEAVYILNQIKLRNLRKFRASAHISNPE